MKKIRVKGIILILLLIGNIVTFSMDLQAQSTNNSKLLIIVNEKTELDEVFLLEYSDNIDLVYHNDMDYYDLKSYSAYAIEKNVIENDKGLKLAIRKEYDVNKSTVYIFGDITISEFKNILGLEVFGAYTYLYDQNGPTTDTAFMRFDEQQENYSIENIISYSKNLNSNHLIANFKFVEEPKFSINNEYIKVIIDHYLETISIAPMTTVVKSDFEIKSYLGSDNYINMDYLLYRVTDEIDPTYDYFALKTNVSAYGTGCERIEVEHKGANTNNIEILDYGPGSILKASSITVGLSFGGPVQGSIGWTFDVGGSPTIDASYSASNESIKWEIKSYWLFGSKLNDQLFQLGSSWASLARKNSVAINSAFRAGFTIGDGRIYTPWETVNIIYDYCDSGPTHPYFNYRNLVGTTHEKYCPFCNYKLVENHKWVYPPIGNIYCSDCLFDTGLSINSIPVENKTYLGDCNHHE